MQTKALIIEDDINYSLEIEMILDKLDVSVIGKSKSWQTISEKIKKLKPDFVILDIFLSKKENGLEFAEKLKQLFIPFIICTGYPEEEYADRAFELGAFAFFSKPIDKSAFAFKTRQLIAQLKDKSDNQNLSIKDKNFLVKIPFREIEWLEIDGNYTSIVVRNGKKYIQKQSLKYFLDLLDDLFVQIHRSYIINSAHVAKLDLNNNTLTTRNGSILPIGSKFKSAVVDLF